jgi:hypothetical protein
VSDSAKHHQSTSAGAQLSKDASGSSDPNDLADNNMQIESRIRKSLNAGSAEVPQLKILVQTHPKEMADNSDEWIEPLMQSQRYAVVVGLCVQLISRFSSDTQLIMKLQPDVARSLLFEGAPKQSLLAAKGMYNVCTLDQMDLAIDLIDQCLHDTWLKDDPDVIQRFQTEQALGIASPANAHHTSGPTTHPETVLQSISAVNTPNALFMSLHHAISTIQGNDYQAFVARGNLFLLTDQIDKAETSFERALQVATDEQKPEAIDNLSRVIKAKDGNAGRAREWLRQRRPTTLPLNR